MLDDLKSLETDGLNIKTEKDVVTLYFYVIFIVGANLGVNSIFGLVESFSAIFFADFVSRQKK